MALCGFRASWPYLKTLTPWLILSLYRSLSIYASKEMQPNKPMSQGPLHVEPLVHPEELLWAQELHRNGRRLAFNNNVDESGHETTCLQHDVVKNAVEGLEEAVKWTMQVENWVPQCRESIQREGDITHELWQNLELQEQWRTFKNFYSCGNLCSSGTTENTQCRDTSTQSKAWWPHWSTYM